MWRLFVLALCMGFFATGIVGVKTVLKQKAPEISILSPLPSYLVNSQLVQSLNIWKPANTHVLSKSTQKPVISAKAAYVYDITTDTVLYDKNSKERLPIASLTKIATAIVALESKKPDTSIQISAKAANVGEDSMGITTGETYTLEELMYGLVLHSGNDAAMAIAEGISGDVPTFVAHMNQKAKILGLTDTFFVNPSGLEEDPPLPHEYSTAYDLAILTKYALSLPLFAKVAATVEYDIPYTSNHKHIYLFN